MSDLPDFPSMGDWHFLGWGRCLTCGIYNPPTQFICANRDCEGRKFLLKEMAKYVGSMPSVTSFPTNNIHIFPEDWLDVCTIGLDALRVELEEEED